MSIRTHIVLGMLLSMLTVAMPSIAQEDLSRYESQRPRTQAQRAKGTKEKKQSDKSVLNGYSGGMLLHIGYGFAKGPEQLFHLKSFTQEDHAPHDGVLMGIGGMMRLHLFNHMHVGAEGYVSTMPLRKSAQVRNGWGGFLVDGYWTWGIVKPFVGTGLGGGSMSRLYVHSSLSDVVSHNATWGKTPYFYFDPYLGMDIQVSRRMNVIWRIDYQLPLAKDRGWSSLVAPNGPRLYLGLIFDHSK